MKGAILAGSAAVLAYAASDWFLFSRGLVTEYGLCSFPIACAAFAVVAWACNRKVV